jgi:hypothetical protein
VTYPVCPRCRTAHKPSAVTKFRSASDRSPFIGWWTCQKTNEPVFLADPARIQDPLLRQQFASIMKTFLE